MVLSPLASHQVDALEIELEKVASLRSVVMGVRHATHHGLCMYIYVISQH